MDSIRIGRRLAAAFWRVALVYTLCTGAAHALSCVSAAPQSPTTSATSGVFNVYAYGVSGDTSRVMFPTWGQPGGQDDLIWYDGVNMGGGTWRVDINLANHKAGNPEFGTFYTHVYVFSASGQYTGCTGIEWSRVPPPPPACGSVGPQAQSTNATSGTFGVFAYGVNASTTRVQFPTWGEAGGQDDLVWYEGVNLGGGTWRADVNLANHKVGNPEFGTFDTHVYLTSASGQFVGCGTMTWSRVQGPPPAPTCQSAAPQAPSTSATSGTFAIFAFGVNASTTRVQFPTWGQPGGQDDLVWYDGVNLGGGTWRADINLGNHKAGNPEYGTFDTHVYVFDASGQYNLCAATAWSRTQQQGMSDSQSVAVLGYHSTDIHGCDNYSDTHIALEQDLETIHSNGFTVTPLKDVLDWSMGYRPGSSMPAKPVVITFDDGSFLDWYDYPHSSCGGRTAKSFKTILEAFYNRHPGIPKPQATSFVIASPAAKRRPELDHLRYVGTDLPGDEWWGPAQASGFFDIQNHSTDHDGVAGPVNEYGMGYSVVLPVGHLADGSYSPGNFCRIGADEGNEYGSAYQAVVVAASYIRAKVGANSDVNIFAAPNGNIGGPLQRYLQNPQANHGVRAAFKGTGGYITRSASQNRFSLTRMAHGCDFTNASELLQVLEGRGSRRPPSDPCIRESCGNYP